MQNPDEIFVTGRFDIALFEPDLYSLLEIQKPDGIMGMAKKRQADHLAGRIFARLALSGLGAERIDLPIGSDRAPIWPNGVKGSLSHSHGHACCLATKNEALTCGVDLEKVASGSGLDAIRQKCLNSSERVWIGFSALKARRCRTEPTPIFSCSKSPNPCTQLCPKTTRFRFTSIS